MSFLNHCEAKSECCSQRTVRTKTNRIEPEIPHQRPARRSLRCPQRAFAMVIPISAASVAVSSR
jgi:hypothetical protein